MEIIFTILICFALGLLLTIAIINAICEHMARKNAEAFKYDYLAKMIAEEVYKQIRIHDKQKAETTTDTTTPNPS